MKLYFKIILVLGLFLLVGCNKKLTLEERKLKVTITSDALAKNLIGEPGKRDIHIFLPPSYNIKNKRFPVVYVLSGYYEPLRSWIDGRYSLHSHIDESVKNGSSNEMIYVMISGYNRFWGSHYVNSPVTGNWEDFIVNDVVSYIDENYKTIPNAASRGIGGHSMGGTGSFKLAMKYPDVFSAVYIQVSGLIIDEELRKSNITPKQFIKHYWETADLLAELSEEDAKAEFLKIIDKVKGKNRFRIAFPYSYGAAFVPMDKPPYVQCGFDREYNPINQELVEKWEDGFGNIKDKVIKYKNNLNSLNGIKIVYAVDDTYSYFNTGNIELSDQLKNENIDHDFLAVDGGHETRFQERLQEHMLPFFSEKLSFE